MTKKLLSIDYREYNSLNELSKSDMVLLQSAIKAASASYAPYSSFNVGAAVMLSDGSFSLGANQENIAFPSGLCAEMTAISSAHANHPSEKIVAIAITGVKDGVMRKEATFPCGQCRQVLAESQKRAGSPIRVVVGGAEKIYVFDSLMDLLPFGDSASIVSSFEE